MSQLQKTRGGQPAPQQVSQCRAGAAVQGQRLTAVNVDAQAKSNRQQLAFWMNEFLLHRGQVQMTNLVMIWKMAVAMYKVAQGQDRIGWVEFLHGKVSTTIRQI
jgi:hypothetical protein